MRTRKAFRVASACVALSLAALGACSSSHRPPEADLNEVSLDAGGGLLQHTPEVTSTDAGTSPPAPDAGDPGSVADAGSSLCGNDRLDPGEQCEPNVTLSDTCARFGFDSGVLACASDCQLDTTGCSGIESCYDGRDNDGDGLVDCADSSDCSGSCVDPCSAPPVLLEHATVQGSTLNRTALLAASCSDAAPSGTEMVYQVTLTEDAKLDVVLTSSQALNLSLRSSCAEVASELACSSQTRLTLDALEGETYFIVVDGASASDAGDYVLQLQTRQPACGDGVRDTDEQCDDGNSSDDDGCDSTCDLESSESEPNNRRTQSNNYDTPPWFARISSQTDVDFYRVNVPENASSLVVRTRDLGDGACALNLMDTVVEIRDGSTVLASDDDGGEGKCSIALASHLDSGDYFVRVSAAAGAAPASFPYDLEIFIDVCGNGNVGLAEECDDANQTNGDGCDASCDAETAP